MLPTMKMVGVTYIFKIIFHFYEQLIYKPLNLKTMNCTIKVTAQYFENYSDTKTPYWKPKGGQEFQIVIDSDVMMYSKYLEEHLTKLVSEQSDEHNKYEYIDHEVQFIEPTVLDKDRLYNLITSEETELVSYE